jgi:hypothetical protein
MPLRLWRTIQQVMVCIWQDPIFLAKMLVNEIQMIKSVDFKEQVCLDRLATCHRELRPPSAPFSLTIMTKRMCLDHRRP